MRRVTEGAVTQVLKQVGKVHLVYRHPDGRHSGDSARIKKPSRKSRIQVEVTEVLKVGNSYKLTIKLQGETDRQFLKLGPRWDTNPHIPTLFQAGSASAPPTLNYVRLGESTPEPERRGYECARTQVRRNLALCSM